MNKQLNMANSLFSLFKEKKMKKNDLKTQHKNLLHWKLLEGIPPFDFKPQRQGPALP